MLKNLATNYSNPNILNSLIFNPLETDTVNLAENVLKPTEKNCKIGAFNLLNGTGNIFIVDT